MEWLEQFDHAATLWVNQHFSEILDVIMLFASSKFGWLPLYLLLLYLFFQKLGLKAFILSLPFVALTITLADQGSVKLFKEVFERYRPCHNLELKEHLRMIIGCGGKYGFLSSHAANTASIAALSFMIIRKKWVFFVMFFYVLLNMYSRMYLGKHYLSDVIAGAFFGAAIGIIVYKLFNIAQQRFIK